MAARSRPGAGNRTRRTHGQNFLVDSSVVDRLLARLELADQELVVDVGAGRGALALPLARAGVKVVAIERDRDLVADLQEQLERHHLADRVRLLRADLRDVTWPRRPFRVVANPPFGLTTALLTRLLDHPQRGPTRADLLLQWEVARKLAQLPPASLRSAAWAPWWRFELGEQVPRRAFRPVPSVDAAWLTVHRRDPPVLPWSLAAGFAEVLRPAWAAENQPGRVAGRGQPRR